MRDYIGENEQDKADADHDTKRMTLPTVFDYDDLRCESRKRGSHFFDPDTMRSFRSRLCAYPVQSVDKRAVFFVTSEKRTGFRAPDGERLYTVRVWYVTSDGQETFTNVGGFQAFRSLSGARANMLRRVAEYNAAPPADVSAWCDTHDPKPQVPA